MAGKKAVKTAKSKTANFDIAISDKPYRPPAKRRLGRCPWCGSYKAPESTPVMAFGRSGDVHHAVVCRASEGGCSAWGPKGHTAAEAAARWNSRWRP